MKFSTLFLALLLISASINAQNSSEIKNSGNNNEFDISQSNVNSGNKSVIENKGRSNKFKQKQEQKLRPVVNINPPKKSKSFWENIWGVINDGNILLGLFASFLTIGLSIQQIAKWKRKKL